MSLLVFLYSRINTLTHSSFPLRPSSSSSLPASPFSLHFPPQRDSLIVDFKPLTTSIPPLGEFDETPQYELEYNIALAGLKDVDESKFQG